MKEYWRGLIYCMRCNHYVNIPLITGLGFATYYLFFRAFAFNFGFELFQGMFPTTILTHAGGHYYVHPLYQGSYDQCTRDTDSITGFRQCFLDYSMPCQLEGSNGDEIFRGWVNYTDLGRCVYNDDIIGDRHNVGLIVGAVFALIAYIISITTFLCIFFCNYSDQISIFIDKEEYQHERDEFYNSIMISYCKFIAIMGAMSMVFVFSAVIIFGLGINGDTVVTTTVLTDYRVINEMVIDYTSRYNGCLCRSYSHYINHHYQDCRQGTNFSIGDFCWLKPDVCCVMNLEGTACVDDRRWPQVCNIVAIDYERSPRNVTQFTLQLSQVDGDTSWNTSLHGRSDVIVFTFDIGEYRGYFNRQPVLKHSFEGTMNKQTREIDPFTGIGDTYPTPAQENTRLQWSMFTFVAIILMIFLGFILWARFNLSRAYYQNKIPRQAQTRRWWEFGLTVTDTVNEESEAEAEDRARAIADIAAARAAAAEARAAASAIFAKFEPPNPTSASVKKIES